MPPILYPFLLLFQPGAILMLIGTVIAGCLWMAIMVGGLRFGEWRPTTSRERWLKAIVTIGSTAVTTIAFYRLLNYDLGEALPWSMIVAFGTMPFSLMIYLGIICRWLGLKDSR
jgi:hypothetical protein